MRGPFLGGLIAHVVDGILHEARVADEPSDRESPAALAKYARRADALDPHTNVQAGVRYFRQLLDTFGATDLALMAYNAGPGRIQRLLAEGNIPPRIRDYSRKVVAELERIRNALLRPSRAESLAAALRGAFPEFQVAAPELRPPAVGASIAR